MRSGRRRTRRWRPAGGRWLAVLVLAALLGPGVALALDPPGPYGPGVHPVLLIVTDECGDIIWAFRECSAAASCEEHRVSWTVMHAPHPCQEHMTEFVRQRCTYE